MSFRLAIFHIIVLLPICASAQEPADAAVDIPGALHKAVAFFREQVAVEGGYVWRYTADLARCEGESKATATMAWVQPPGTPSVGMAFLDAFEKTGDRYYLEAATETARALVKGQLASGGWEYHIEFDPAKRKEYAYRVGGNPGGRNTTTLDDDTTQAALRLLIRVDRALDFQDAAIREAARFGLEALLEAQYPNGAWPQRYREFPDPARFPVKKAEYPETWERIYPKKEYTSYYTFNDNTIADVIETMFLAAETYSDNRYRDAAVKAGGFILLAQMPDPQPAWAQQYDADMHPAWARKFEPPAVTGGESQGVMRVLIYLYGKTEDARYLDAADRALAYLKASRLPDGRLARFYELRTNTPLFFTKAYELTYSDADVPTHYCFAVPSDLDNIEKACHKAREQEPRAETLRPPQMTPDLERRAADAAKALDARGAWVEPGRLRYWGEDDPAREIVDCETFIRNVGVLADFVAASAAKE